ncbi:MAG TPA: hypothetical protein VMJ65_07575 [Solirubrobacteraceae bacterium]|nr:hypothetical protein [Solirubrobacteraceae bacterium]
MNVRSWWLRLALASGMTVGALGALALHSPPAEAMPDGPTTVLVGVTTQSYPSFFRISANGKTVKASVIGLGMSCTSGATFGTPDEFAHIRIGPNGNLHAGLNIPPTAVSGGATYTGTDSLSARLNRQRTEVTGVWELQLSYTFADGTTDRCDSGPVRFVDTR